MYDACKLFQGQCTRTSDAVTAINSCSGLDDSNCSVALSVVETLTVDGDWADDDTRWVYWVVGDDSRPLYWCELMSLYSCSFEPSWYSVVWKHLHLVRSSSKWHYMTNTGRSKMDASISAGAYGYKRTNLQVNVSKNLQVFFVLSRRSGGFYILILCVPG